MPSTVTPGARSVACRHAELHTMAIRATTPADERRDLGDEGRWRAELFNSIQILTNIARQTEALGSLTDVDMKSRVQALAYNFPIRLRRGAAPAVFPAPAVCDLPSRFDCTELHKECA
jgi:hypothetical protein